MAEEQTTNPEETNQETPVVETTTNEAQANPEQFLKALKLIKPSMSLAGIESTMLLPSLTSHALLSPEERADQGSSDGLIRFSGGMENSDDLLIDINNALHKTIG